MEIRAATAADVPGIVTIANEAIANGFAHFGDRPWTVEEAEADLAGAGPRHVWLVADDGGVIGYCYGRTYKPRGGYDRTVEVAVYVHHEARGRGVGRALYDEFIPRLKARGIRCALAGIALPNPGSVALHEAFGFTPVGVFRRVGWKLGAWRDVGYWELHLDGADPTDG